MKYYILILSLILYAHASFAQSTPWYYGGKADGHASVKVTNFTPSILASNAVYAGARGDGGATQAFNNFSPITLNHQLVYAGNKGDGGATQALNNFSPIALNHQLVYAGNKGDGGANANLNNFIPTALSHFSMYKGFKGDGGSMLAVNNFTPSKVKQYTAYFGGKGDGWSNQLATAWILPIGLLSFDGKAQGTSNFLTWITSYEENVDYFLVEKSKNAVEFEQIASVNAKGNSAIKVNYEYTDTKDVQGINYYRLNMTDKDDKFTYSKVIRLVNEKLDYSITLSPNPASNSIRLGFSRALESNSQFIVYDMNGKIVIRSVLQKDESVKNIDISALSAGSYLIQIQTSNDNVSLPFIKN